MTLQIKEPYFRTPPTPLGGVQLLPNQLVDATVLEYGAPQDRAKGSNNLAANIFLHFKEVLKDFDLARTVGTSKVVMEPAGGVGIFSPWDSRAGLIAVKGGPAICPGWRCVFKT